MSTHLLLLFPILTKAFPLSFISFFLPLSFLGSFFCPFASLPASVSPSSSPFLPPLTNFHGVIFFSLALFSLLLHSLFLPFLFPLAQFPLQRLLPNFHHPSHSSFTSLFLKYIPVPPSIPSFVLHYDTSSLLLFLLAQHPTFHPRSHLLTPSFPSSFILYLLCLPPSYFVTLFLLLPICNTLRPYFLLPLSPYISSSFPPSHSLYFLFLYTLPPLSCSFLSLHSIPSSFPS